MIDIKDISGNVIFSTPINEGSKRKFTLQKEDCIILKFSLESPVYFKLGDWVDDEFGLFELVDLYKPTFNNSTGGYDYELRLDAYYWKWKNKIFKFTPETAGQEASWNLTAPLDVQAGMVLGNLKALGYTFRGKDFEFSIDSTVVNKAQLMSYDNINILDACFEMAKKWDCECWVTENVIHFGRCEYGDAVNFESGKNVEKMTRSDSQSDYATRIYAFGSTRNIPTDYRPVDETMVVNGVVQRRLMLPAGTPYIDAYPNMRTEEAIEQVVVFDDVYPRRIGSVSDVTTKEYTDSIENADGTTTKEKWNAYRFKDTGIIFSEKYRLSGEDLKITFQSGSLNGMEFAVSFNPDGVPEKLSDGTWNPSAQIWEIVRNEDYGRPLPDEVLCPRTEHMEGDLSVPADTYILSGFDTELVSDQMLPAAELELKLKAIKHAAKLKIDPSTYNVTMMSDCMIDENDNPKLYEAGDRVNLINPAFFETGSRVSRIIGFEYDLDYPFDSPVYTVGETASYSRIAELENKVDSLTYKGQTYTGGWGSGVYLITSNDSTVPTDRNAFSSKRALLEFLNKKTDDTAAGVITFLKGFISKLQPVFNQGWKTEGWAQGTSGSGLYQDNDGNWHLESDYVNIRRKLTAEEIEIQKTGHIGGKLMQTSASMICCKVETLTSVYRCYMLLEDADGNKIYNQFKVNDQALVETFNLTKQSDGKIGNHFLWRLVTAVGDDYIDLSKSVCASQSDAPRVGDHIVQLGYRGTDDLSRQTAIIMAGAGEGSPYYKQYTGIDSFTLPEEDTRLKPGDNKVSGKLVIESGSSGYNNLTDKPDITAAIDESAKELTDYINGAFSDGVISESEVKSIRKYVGSTKVTVEATYNKLYSNSYLEGTSKTTLLNAKISLWSAIETLLSAIDSAIADGNITTDEKNSVDSKLNLFNTALGDFYTAVEIANIAIQNKLKAYSDNLSNTLPDQVKNAVAQKMGYTDFAAMETAAEAGNTIIEGGKINTKLIEAAIVLTSQLIADAIQTSTLNVNDKFIVESDGTFKAVGGELKDMLLTGALRSPFTNGFFSYAGYLGDHEGLQNNNNVVIPNPGTSDKTCHVPNTYEYSGFNATIVNDDFEGVKTVGNIRLYSSYGVNFYEDGVRTDDLYIEPHSGIDIQGLSDGVNRFRGWMVKNRFKSSTAETETYYTISLKVSPAGAGTTSGGGSKPAGSTGVITATPNTGYEFLRWDDGITEASRTIQWSGSTSYTAYFSAIQFVISLKVSPSGAGTVSGGGIKPAGTVSEISATAGNGYVFSHWSDGNSNITRMMTWNENKSLTAYFITYVPSTDELLTNANLVNTTGFAALATDMVGTNAFNVFNKILLWSATVTSGTTRGMSFNKGLLAGKMAAGRQYRLTVDVSAVNNSGNNLIIAIGSVLKEPLESFDTDFNAMGTGNTVYLHTFGSGYETVTMEFTAKHTSTADDCIIFITNVMSGVVNIKNISLKEVIE